MCFVTVIFIINGFRERNYGNFSLFEDIIAVGLKVKALTLVFTIGYYGFSLVAMYYKVPF